MRSDAGVLAECRERLERHEDDSLVAIAEDARTYVVALFGAYAPMGILDQLDDAAEADNPDTFADALDLLEVAFAEDRDRGRTHWPGCWKERYHDGCKEALRDGMHGLVLDELEMAGTPEAPRVADQITAKAMLLLEMR